MEQTTAGDESISPGRMTTAKTSFSLFGQDICPKETLD